MIFTALGDSITAGAGLSSPALAFPALTIRNLSLSMSPVLARGMSEVLAESGWTSRDLFAAVLEQSPAPLAHAGVVSVWIGGNDLAKAAITAMGAPPGARDKALYATINRALIGYQKNLHRLLEAVRWVSRARLVVFTQYNPFPHTAAAAAAIGGMNAITRTVARRHKALVADAALWFVGHEAQWILGYRRGRVEDVLPGDPLPVHPNVRGHQAIADRLTALLVQAGQPTPPASLYWATGRQSRCNGRR
jgi:acyl-CoA thioesterase-1